MIQQQFVERVTAIVQKDESIIGLAIGGSWINMEIDAFSDLDFILVTDKKVAGDKHRMMDYAAQFGELLTGFTGEHVGEPRLLICLYDNPLLHVDIKFLTLAEFHNRVETPVILFDRLGALQQVLDETASVFPYPDYQWIEDRFWTWIHYGLLKIGRGEYFEAMNFLGFLRMVVFGPLLHIKSGNLPRGVRKVETILDPDDLKRLASTIATNDKASLIKATEQAVALYVYLRGEVFPTTVKPQHKTEERVREYLTEIRG